MLVHLSVNLFRDHTLVAACILIKIVHRPNTHLYEAENMWREYLAHARSVPFQAQDQGHDQYHGEARSCWDCQAAAQAHVSLLMNLYDLNIENIVT